MAPRLKSPPSSSMPEPVGYAAFETAIGAMGIAWTRSAVAMVQLPEKDAGATLARLRSRLPRAGVPTDLAEAPAWLRRAVAAIQRHLAGRPQDLSAIPLELDAIAPFRRRVYEAARRVPSGQTVTYGELSRLAGSPGASRAVGSAMATNPFPMLVPCHRVVASGGKPGGFTARGGAATKARILTIEGAAPRDAAASQQHVAKVAAKVEGFTGAPATPATASGATPKGGRRILTPKPCASSPRPIRSSAR